MTHTWTRSYCALADNITSPDAGALSLSLKNLFAHYVCALYEYDAIMILDDDAMFPHGPRPVEDAIRYRHSHCVVTTRTGSLASFARF